MAGRLAEARDICQRVLQADPDQPVALHLLGVVALQTGKPDIAATIIAKSAQSFIPIHITSDPTTLTKAEKWYQIPHRKVHFKIVIGDSYDPRSMLVGETSLVRTNRKVNEVLKTLLSGDVEQHGHVG